MNNQVSLWLSNVFNIQPHITTVLVYRLSVCKFKAVILLYCQIKPVALCGVLTNQFLSYCIPSVTYDIGSSVLHFCLQQENTHTYTQYTHIDKIRLSSQSYEKVQTLCY